ncbi:hypothetical protein BCR44DRAFT_1446932 [Catenaria anguillulae PL171]|uniref:Uncharacterized protein n=1 Tax=Catenaria anguillulae PL171 TaxID=765915 RepID=A0A1Y2H5X0_9FUNG|nr:hypothetical protein BCR44DRAFT_1446932 [Catenaria anguillulae PL171]
MSGSVTTARVRRAFTHPLAKSCTRRATFQPTFSPSVCNGSAATVILPPPPEPPRNERRKHTCLRTRTLLTSGFLKSSGRRLRSRPVASRQATITPRRMRPCWAMLSRTCLGIRLAFCVGGTIPRQTVMPFTRTICTLTRNHGRVPRSMLRAICTSTTTRCRPLSNCFPLRLLLHQPR